MVNYMLRLVIAAYVDNFVNPLTPRISVNYD